MKYTILAADDEVELLEVLELYLAKEQIQLLKCQSGLEVLEQFDPDRIHLLLLDIMMPGLDGVSVLKKIRESSNVPAIMISAKDQDYDKILGLQIGADDYITKPFNPLEVVARIQAQLRRAYDYRPEPEESDSISLFDLTLNMSEGALKKGADPVNLTSTELKILHLFMSNPGRVFTKRQIFEHVWEDSYLGDENTIMMHMSNLRNKIEENPKRPRLLKTIKGLGYKIEKDVAK